MPDRSFAERLSRESKRWVADGLVSAEQAEALRARYPAEPEARRGRATEVLASIGAIAVGIGVIGFVAANWEELAKVARLVLLTALVAATYAGAYHLRERTGRLPRVGEALYLLGVLLFGATLFLVGQMYNVEAHDPLALLLWAGAATATALVVRSRPLAGAAVLIFTLWAGFEVGLALEDVEGGEAALTLATIPYGCALYGLGTAAVDRFRTPAVADSGFPTAMRALGLPIAVLALFVFTFADAVEELAGAADDVGGAAVAVVGLVAALALAAAAAVALGGRPTARGEGAALAAIVVVPVTAALAGGSETGWAIAFNVLFAAVAVGLVYAGYVADEPWLVNAGIALVALDLIVRYFDVFWDALPRSVGMIGAGLLVLGIAWVLERQRQRLLERMAA